MALWLALAVLGQEDDWSEWVADRAPRAVELESLRRRLTDWGGRLDLPEFAGFGRAVRIDDARVRSLYRIAATVLDERREVARRREPYLGTQRKVRTVSEPDLWAPPTPAFEGVKEMVWRVPVDGSHQTGPCAACGGVKESACADCPKVQAPLCLSCLGMKVRFSCAACGGVGWKSCTSCGGKGTTGTRRSEFCRTCFGAGGRKCTVCPPPRPCEACGGTGKGGCRTCGGKKRARCSACAGAGQQVDFLEVVITLRPWEVKRTLSRLPGAWIVRVPEEDRWVTLEPVRIGEIPDPELREAVVAAARGAREAAAGKVRKERVLVQRVPCLHVSYSFGGLDYELVATDREILMDRSPVRDWAERTGEEAKSLAAAPEGRARAEAIALRVLRADPECAAAQEALAAVRKGRGTDLREQRSGSETGAVRGVLMTGLFTLAGIILAVMIALKLYLVRRGGRRAPAHP